MTAVMIFTIGHSTRSFEELAAVLRAWDVRTLVDVRTIPRSRKNPQFEGETLAASLASVGIDYVRIAQLGGLRGRTKAPGGSRNLAWENASFRNYADYALTPAFEEGLRELLAIASRANVAIMCAEILWWRCHRRIIADHLIARGVEVTHLFDAAKAERARLSPFAKVNRGTVIYPARAADTARGERAST